MGMKYLVAGFLALLCGFFLADLVVRQKMPELQPLAQVPFDHSLHGDSIGLDCNHCHGGAHFQGHAYMPSKKDCMDCHRLPLTEKPGIEKLDSLLALSGEFPWNHKKVLPEHVVFHHGLHYAAGVQCSDCHRPLGGADYRGGLAKGKPYSMQMCVDCHARKTFKDKDFKPAAVYCGACHR
jgi:hypothetical protein